MVAHSISIGVQVLQLFLAIDIIQMQWLCHLCNDRAKHFRMGFINESETLLRWSNRKRAAVGPQDNGKSIFFPWARM